MILLYAVRIFRQCQKPPNLGRLCTAFGSNCINLAILLEYIQYIMHAGVYSHAVCRGPCRAFWAGRPKRRRAPARAVCRAALRVSSVSGVGAAVGVTVRPLAPPLGELLSGCEAERASTPTNTQKGSGSRSQEPLPRFYGVCKGLLGLPCNGHDSLAVHGELQARLGVSVDADGVTTTSPALWNRVSAVNICTA